MGWLSDIFGGKKVVVGFDYWFTIHMGIGRGPMDALVEIKVGDRAVYPKTVAAMGDAAVPPNSEYESLFRLAGSDLTGTTIGTVDLGGNSYLATLPVALFGLDPAVFGNPPFVPGKRVRLTDFRRMSVNAYGQSVEANISAEYYIGPTPPRVLVDAEGVGTYGMAAGSITIVIPGVRLQDWYRYILPTAAFYGSAPGEAVSSAIPGTAPTIEAIDWTNFSDIPLTEGEITGNSIVDNRSVYIDAYKVFGGREGEGGIQGWLTTMFGFDTQYPATDLTSPTMLGQPLSGFRGMMTVVFRGVIATYNPYPKPWKFRMRRSKRGWDGPVFIPELATIILTRPLGPKELTASALIYAMNPAHIIYECLTNRLWGRGLPASALDYNSFWSAAQTLFSEAFGICIRWSRRDSIESFAQSILDHIGAVMYTDRTTAKIKLDLIRGNYSTSELPLFDAESGLLEIQESSIMAGHTYVNEIEVVYHDPISDKDGTIKVQNLASLQSTNGQVNALKKEYPGLPIASLARRVAQRDLRTNGTGLRRFTLLCDRRAWKVTPGFVIKIQDLSRGIEPMVLRVGPTKDGTLTDGRISITAMQDVFTLPATSFIGTQAPTWTPPITAPCIARHKVFEMPYFALAADLTDAQFVAVNPLKSHFGVVAEQGRPLLSGYLLAVRPTAPTVDDTPSNNASYCGYVPPGG